MSWCVGVCASVPDNYRDAEAQGTPGPQGNTSSLDDTCICKSPLEETTLNFHVFFPLYLIPYTLSPRQALPNKIKHSRRRQPDVNSTVR
jgi:hypothetical protein